MYIVYTKIYVAIVGVDTLLSISGSRVSLNSATAEPLLVPPGAPPNLAGCKSTASAENTAMATAANTAQFGVHAAYAGLSWITSAFRPVLGELPLHDLCAALPDLTG